MQSLLRRGGRGGGALWSGVRRVGSSLCGALGIGRALCRSLPLCCGLRGCGGRILQPRAAAAGQRHGRGSGGVAGRGQLFRLAHTVHLMRGGGHFRFGRGQGAGRTAGHEHARFRIQKPFQIVAHGNKALAAACPQVADDAGQVVHRAFVRVMKQKNAPQGSGLVDRAQSGAQGGILGGQALPVAAVQRPEQNREPQFTGHFFRIGVKGPVGRPQKHWRGPQGTQHGVGAANFLGFALR